MTPTLPRAAAPDAPLTPLTFRERGVVLPATTPAFAFARLRGAGGGRELVLRHAAGTRGAMVIPLAKAEDFARPSLHDRTLFSDLAALPVLGPAQVATAARAAARAGLAGRSALAAAALAGEGEQRAARASLGQLLAELAQRGGAAAKADDAAREPRRFAATFQEPIARGAASLGLAVPSLPGLLARLAPLVAAAERLGALLPRLRVFAAMAGDTATLLRERLAEEAAFIGSAAMATLGFAQTLLHPALETLAEPARALETHAADPNWPQSVIERTLWVLDGWPYLLGRWDEAAGQGQAAEMRAFRAIAAGVPPLPAELASTAEERAAVRATWRPAAPAVTGASDQALLERLRVAVP